MNDTESTGCPGAQSSRPPVPPSPPDSRSEPRPVPREPADGTRSDRQAGGVPHPERGPDQLELHGQGPYAGRRVADSPVYRPRANRSTPTRAAARSSTPPSPLRLRGHRGGRRHLVQGSHRHRADPSPVLRHPVQGGRRHGGFTLTSRATSPSRSTATSSTTSSCTPTRSRRTRPTPTTPTSSTSAPASTRPPTTC